MILQERPAYLTKWACIHRARFVTLVYEYNSLRYHEDRTMQTGCTSRQLELEAHAGRLVVWKFDGSRDHRCVDSILTPRNRGGPALKDAGSEAGFDTWIKGRRMCMAASSINSAPNRSTAVCPVYGSGVVT